MTSNKMIRSIAGLFVAGLLAASCGGSSDEDSAAEFCDKITASEAADTDGDLSQAGLDRFQEMADAAPSEIKAEVVLVNDLFKELFAAGEDEAKLTAAMASISDEEFAAAGEKLEAWEAENCEASSSSAPSSAVGRV